MSYLIYHVPSISAGRLITSASRISRAAHCSLLSGFRPVVCPGFCSGLWPGFRLRLRRNLLRCARILRLCSVHIQSLDSKRFYDGIIRDLVAAHIEILQGIMSLQGGEVTDLIVLQFQGPEAGKS